MEVKLTAQKRKNSDVIKSPRASQEMARMEYVVGMVGKYRHNVRNLPYGCCRCRRRRSLIRNILLTIEEVASEFHSPSDGWRQDVP